MATFSPSAGAPVKLDLSMMDNIASGALLQFGHMKVAPFTKQVVRWGNGTESLRRSLYYFVGDGPHAGAGRFSAGMATHVQGWVRSAIMFEEARETHVASGFLGPPRRDMEYVKWLLDVGKGGQPTYFLMGAVARAFGVLRNSAGGHTLGISPNEYTRPPAVGTTPLTLQSFQVNVAEYAKKVEFGTKYMAKRPIITGSIVGWLEKAQPEWAKMLRSYMKDTWKIGYDYHKHTGINPLDAKDLRTAETASMHGDNEVANAKNRGATADQYEQQGNMFDQMAKLFQSGSDYKPSSREIEAMETYIEQTILKTTRGKATQEMVDATIKVIKAGGPVPDLLVGPYRYG